MSNSLSIRLKSKLLSWSTVLGVLVGFALLMWFPVTNWLQYNRLIGPASFSQMCSDFVNEVLVAHAQSGFDLFAPIFAVLPSVTIFCDDYNSGYIKSILCRSSKRKYITNCIVCCSISGGLAVLLPDLLCSSIFMLVSDPHLPDAYGSSFALYSNIEFVWGGRLLILVFLFFSFLFGVVWANIGLCISAYAPNKFIALAAPFALYYGATLILQRTGYFAILAPENMIQPTYAELPNLFFPLIYQLLLLCGALILFCKRINRRLQNV